MLKFRCAWHNCYRTCDADPLAPLPPGWIFFVTFKEVHQRGMLDFAVDKVRRDAVLCHQHAHELERLLWPLPEDLE